MALQDTWLGGELFEYANVEFDIVEHQVKTTVPVQPLGTPTMRRGAFDRVSQVLERLGQGQTQWPVLVLAAENGLVKMEEKGVARWFDTACVAGAIVHDDSQARQLMRATTHACDYSERVYIDEAEVIAEVLKHAGKTKSSLFAS